MASDQHALLFVNKQLNDYYSWHCNYYCDRCGGKSMPYTRLIQEDHVGCSDICQFIKLWITPRHFILFQRLWYGVSKGWCCIVFVVCNGEFAIFQLLKCFSLRLLKWRMAHKYIPLQTQRRSMILLVTFNGSVIFPLFNALLDIISNPQIVPLTPPSSDCDTNTSFSIDPAQRAYLHISGVAVNCDEKEATFDVKIDQYISTLKDVKSSPSKFVTPFSCSIPDLPQYKTGKPVPYNRWYISISGFLTDVTYKPDSDVVQWFHLKVENIVFLSQQCNVMGMIPNSLDSAFFFPNYCATKFWPSSLQHLQEHLALERDW